MNPSHSTLHIRHLMVRMGDLKTVNDDPSQGLENGDILARLRDLTYGESEELAEEEPDEFEDA